MGLSGFTVSLLLAKKEGKELNEEGGFVCSARHSNTSLAYLTSGLTAKGHTGL